MSNNNIITRIVTITPDMAEELLAMNLENRRVKNVNVIKVSTALKNGEWKFNGEAIKIAEDGTVLDGQHRLIACVKTGIPFETVLVEGLEKRSQDTMDKGSPRSLADTLQLHGYTNSLKLSTVVRTIMLCEQVGLKIGLENSGPKIATITAPMVLKRLSEEPGLVDVTRYAVSGFNKLGLTAKVSGVLFYELSKIDGDDAQFFFDSIRDPSNLAADHPILALRKALQTISSQSARHRTSSSYLGALVVKAWNAFRDGRSMKSLTFRAGGAHPESFPMPI